MKQSKIITCGLFVGLVAMGVGVRLALQDLPNFAPVAALALFAGYLFPSRTLAIAVPMAVMGISDLFIGHYAWQMMVLVYAMLLLPAMWGRPLRRTFQRREATAGLSAAALITCSLGASLAFFTVTNFGAWYWHSIYEPTLAGLGQCYLAALPFFRYTLAGDLFFATSLFGSLAAVQAFLAASHSPACELGVSGK